MINIIKLKENLVYKFNRLFVGIAIVSVLLATYLLNIDLIFNCISSILVFYELNKSIIKNKFIIISLYLLFIFLFYIFNFWINNFFFILIIIFLFLLCSIYIDKYFEIFFIFFVINILILVSILFNIDKNLIYLIIAISFINDTIAYIAGSNIKGPLISPKISPNKTWSGTSISFFVTTFTFVFLDYNLIVSSIMAISLFYGDIYFSYIKRKLDIKDFSTLLSTHGGVLDRLDSISFLIIVFGILNQ